MQARLETLKRFYLTLEECKLIREDGGQQFYLCFYLTLEECKFKKEGVNLELCTVFI